MSEPWKVVINEPWDTTLETHRALEEAGCELVLGIPNWETTNPCYDEDQLLEMARDADAIMGASRERYTGKLFASCPRLRILSKYGIGTETIDVDAASRAGVLELNVPRQARRIRRGTFESLTLPLVYCLGNKYKIN